jgi:hypothetical protein
MSNSLEFAIMLHAIADMSKPGPTRDALRSQADACLADVPAEMEHEAAMARLLLDRSRKTFSGGKLEIPISYV